MHMTAAKAIVMCAARHLRSNSALASRVTYWECCQRGPAGQRYHLHVHYHTVQAISIENSHALYGRQGGAWQMSFCIARMRADLPICYA